MSNKSRNHESTRNNTKQLINLIRVVSCEFVVSFFVSQSFVSCSKWLSCIKVDE